MAQPVVRDGFEISGTTTRRIQQNNAPVGFVFYDETLRHPYVMGSAGWERISEEEQSSSSSSSSSSQSSSSSSSSSVSSASSLSSSSSSSSSSS